MCSSECLPVISRGLESLLGDTRLRTGSALKYYCITSVVLVMVGFAPTFAGEPLLNEPLGALPTVESLQLDPAKIALGKRLFHDTRLSKDLTTSCASCHDLSKAGVDNLKRSLGVRRQEGGINSPTVFNSGLNFKQFWDGRATTLEEQIDQVVHNPLELDMTWSEIVERLNADTELAQEFKVSYPEGLGQNSIQEAIATFERSLLTPSRFDRYLKGDEKALSETEQKGYQLFKSYGCIACHQGVNIGGNMFQKFGALNDYFTVRGNLTKADLGRFNVTQKEADRHVFKVPSLRNVALTAPYFHDGSAESLEAAIEVMFRHQLGRTAPDEDKALIAQFLKTLTGETVGAKP